MLEKYYRITEVVGLSIQIELAGEISIYACQISVNDNKLTFKRTACIHELRHLQKLFPAKTYVALNLSGKGIVNKQYTGVEPIDANIFGSILTNAKIDEFYVQQFVSGEQSFVSAVRRNDADKWLNLLSEMNFSTLSLSLGPFPIDLIMPQLNVYDQDFVINGHLVRRDLKHSWLSYKYDQHIHSDFPIKVESEMIAEEFILPYAAAFQLVLPAGASLTQANVPELGEKLKDLVETNKLKVKGAIALFIFFILLLVNFFMFSYYTKAKSEIEAKLSTMSRNNLNLQDISYKITNKEAALRSLGWDKGINKSLLVDQIMSLLPQEITLKEITVNPLDQSLIRTQRSIVFKDRQIRVTGISDKIIPVEEWIARIKTKTWVDNVQLNSYVYNNELNSGEFVIIINY